MGLERMLKRIVEGNPGEAEAEAKAIGERREKYFNDLPAEKQHESLDAESAELRGEIDALRKHADDLEGRFDEIVRARAISAALNQG